MIRAVRRISQLIFLAVFVFLTVTGKIQLWMGLFLAGVLASFLLGRVFCGWICFIDPVLEAVSRLKMKLHIRSFRIPAALRKPWLRILVLGVFLLAFGAVMVMGRKLPVLHVLLAAAILLTFFFPEELWHTHLCPYGTILSLTSRKAPHGMRINKEKCTNCGACSRACSAAAIEKRETRHEIHGSDCLVCMACTEACKIDAVRYQ